MIKIFFNGAQLNSIILSLPFVFPASIDVLLGVQDVCTPLAVFSRLCGFYPLVPTLSSLATIADLMPVVVLFAGRGGGCQRRLFRVCHRLLV
jgi:hypothetical protein